MRSSVSYTTTSSRRLHILTRTVGDVFRCHPTKGKSTAHHLDMEHPPTSRCVARLAIQLHREEHYISAQEMRVMSSGATLTKGTSTAHRLDMEEPAAGIREVGGVGSGRQCIYRRQEAHVDGVRVPVAPQHLAQVELDRVRHGPPCVRRKNGQRAE